jgi:hypothetical protein
MYIAMNETLCIHSKTIERVKQFAYLGSIINNTGGMEADTKARIQKAQIALSALTRSGNQQHIRRKQNFASSTPT